MKITDLIIALLCFSWVISVALAYVVGRFHEMKYWEKKGRL